jgi:hypothetical protein
MAAGEGAGEEASAGGRGEETGTAELCRHFFK